MHHAICLFTSQLSLVPNYTYAAASGPGLEPATTRSQVRRPTTKPPRHPWCGLFWCIAVYRPDGRFRINNLPAGSYVVDVAHTEYSFEPIRVDINSRGKRRARRINRLKPSEVRPLPYPLRFTARRKTAYFDQRNTLTLAEILSHPMVRLRHVE